MGQLLTLGVGLCLACTVVFLPALLVMLTRHREEELDDELPSLPSASEEPETRSASEGELLIDVPLVTRSVSEGVPRVDIPLPTIAATSVSEEQEARRVSKGEPQVDLIPLPAPVSHPATITYFRIDLPDPVPARETFTLSDLHAQLTNQQENTELPAKGGSPAGTVGPEAQPTDEGPILFGPVATNIPRRRLIPRRVAGADALNEAGGPVAGQADQVH
jgi:hypothetical protein